MQADLKPLPSTNASSAFRARRTTAVPLARGDVGEPYDLGMGLVDNVARQIAENSKEAQRRADFSAAEARAISDFRAELAEACQMLTQHQVANSPIFFDNGSNSRQLQFTGAYGWSLGSRWVLVGTQLAKANWQRADPGRRIDQRWVSPSDRKALGLSQDSLVGTVYPYPQNQIQEFHDYALHGNQLTLPVYMEERRDEVYAWLARGVAYHLQSEVAP